MKKIIFRISIIAILFAVLLQFNIFAGYNITIETITDAHTYAVGGTVNVTVDWTEELQAVGFILRYNSTKLSFVESSISDDYYRIVEVTAAGTTENKYKDISVQWADGSSKTNITFKFKAIAPGNADISVINANAFSNANIQQPEQIDYTTKGSKTIKITTLGDINLDNVVNMKDVVLLNQYVSNMAELNEEALLNADVCTDEEINQLDVDILNKYVSGWAISFPFIYGDSNCDGRASIEDVSELQRYILFSFSEGHYELSREGLNRSDVNLDGVINEFDIIVMQRYLAEIEGYLKLPVIIGKNNNYNTSNELHKFNIDDQIMLSGFDVSNLKVSNIKQQFNDSLKVDIYNVQEEKLDDNILVGTGCTIKIDEKTIEDVYETLVGIIGEYTTIIYGDTTGDGKINAIDALALIKDINNKIPFTSEVYRQAGRIVTPNNQNPTAVDALAIIKAANGKYEINQNK